MNPESRNIYNRLPEDHELVEHYKPVFLARGGDHLVYTVEGHPDVVIKASTFKIKDTLHENAENNQPLDLISEEQRVKLEKEIAEKNIQIQQLIEYFGKDHTLREKRYLMQVPVSMKILEEIFKSDWQERQPPIDYQNITEAWSSVTVQRRSEEVLDQKHKGLYSGGFLEERGYDELEYKDLNDSLVIRPTLNTDTISLFLKLQDNPKTHAIADLVNIAESDENLKKVLRDLTKKMISYAEHTGNILALAGEDNIILNEKGGNWNYVLIDALPVHNEAVVAVARGLVHKYLNGEPLAKHEKTLIMKALNFVRLVNGLALCLGIEERLTIISDQDLEKDINFADIIK